MVPPTSKSPASSCCACGEDGRAIEEIAEEAGLRAETIESWLEDVEPSLRDALAGAMPGDVLGPLAWKEAHLVLAVDDKRLPSEGDALVRARAERALLARTVDHEVARSGYGARPLVEPHGISS